MGESITWLALTEGRDTSAALAAPVTDGDADLWLCAWLTDRGWRRPHRDAQRCAPAIVGDGEGPWAVAITSVDRRKRPLYDDPAVVAATRRALASSGAQLPIVSAFVADEVHWAGGLCAMPLDVAQRWPGWTSLDPWHGLGERRVMHVGSGVLRAAPRPAGPGHQRYYGAPWPHLVWPSTS